MAKNAAAEDPPPDRPRPSIRSSKTPHPTKEEVMREDGRRKREEGRGMRKNK